jgi:hypothetical protein
MAAIEVHALVKQYGPVRAVDRLSAGPLLSCGRHIGAFTVLVDRS